jgi:hypothetical protein
VAFHSSNELLVGRTPKDAMAKYNKIHDRDGIALYFCFLIKFAGNATEHILEAMQQLTAQKPQLTLYNNIVPRYTVQISFNVCKLIREKQALPFEIYMNTFHGCIDAPNDEFKAFVISKSEYWRNNQGTTRITPMFDFLASFDAEYRHLHNLGR